MKRREVRQRKMIKKKGKGGGEGNEDKEEGNAVNGEKGGEESWYWTKAGMKMHK